MNTVTSVKEWRSLREALSNSQIGFVPTMGNLHAGHRSLCERSLAENEITVASIFVNPTQFNQAQDFDRYPRTLDADLAMLTDVGVDYVFIPDTEGMYADQYQIKVMETELSRELEGEFRPGHFDGMLTVVMKLFNLVRPEKAYFGEKDYQQLLLVKKMVDALFMPVQIVSCPTLRAEDKLALSSRNNRLNAEQRQLAAALPQLLHSGSCTTEIKVEYITDRWGRRLAAAWLGNVRLIDNIPL
jgi:pantoate--beta-alanine ligase